MKKKALLLLTLSFAIILAVEGIRRVYQEPVVNKLPKCISYDPSAFKGGFDPKFKTRLIQEALYVYAHSYFYTFMAWGTAIEKTPLDMNFADAQLLHLQLVKEFELDGQRRKELDAYLRNQIEIVKDVANKDLPSPTFKIDRDECPNVDSESSTHAFLSIMSMDATLSYLQDAYFDQKDRGEKTSERGDYLSLIMSFYDVFLDKNPSALREAVEIARVGIRAHVKAMLDQWLKETTASHRSE